MHSGFPQFLMKLHNFLCLTSDLTFNPQTVWSLYQPLKKQRIALEIEKRNLGSVALKSRGLPQSMTVTLEHVWHYGQYQTLKRKHIIFGGHFSGKYWQLCGLRKLSGGQWGRSPVRSHGKSSSVLLSAPSNSFQEMSFTWQIKLFNS